MQQLEFIGPATTVWSTAPLTPRQRAAAEALGHRMEPPTGDCAAGHHRFCGPFRLRRYGNVVVREAVCADCGLGVP